MASISNAALSFKTSITFLHHCASEFSQCEGVFVNFPSVTSKNGLSGTLAGVSNSYLHQSMSICGKKFKSFNIYAVSSPESLSSDPYAHGDHHIVGEFMTPTPLISAKPSTTVDEALQLLVENRITGLPVVDDNDVLVGVVSDYDLLALDSISGKREAETGLFPSTGSTWKAFKEVQKLIGKVHGCTVSELMTPSPLVVRPMTNLEDAAKILLVSKYRRLPVVDDNGRLVGILTRGNVIKAALEIRKHAQGTRYI